MKIQLPPIDLSNHKQVYAGYRRRYATATSAAYKIDHGQCIDRLISAQYLNRTLYLHDITQSFKIIDSINIDYYVDIIDYKYDIVISSNMPSYNIETGSLSIIDLIDDKFRLRKTILLPNVKSHGCKLITSSEAVVTNTANAKNILFIDINTDDKRSFSDFLYFPKDIYHFDDKLLIISSASQPSMSPVDILNSILYLYEYPSMTLIESVDVPGQADSITKSGQHIFITLQGNDCLAYLTYDEKLRYIGTIPGYNFPHGITSHKDDVCVTNYGDNTLQISKLNELIANVVSE